MKKQALHPLNPQRLVGNVYRYMGRKVHVVAVVLDGREIVIVTKWWTKFRWEYEAGPMWLFLQFSEGLPS